MPSMPNLSTLKTLTTSRNFWYIIIALAAFISVAIYVYSNYIAPTIQPAYVPNKEFVKEMDDFFDHIDGIISKDPDEVDVITDREIVGEFNFIKHKPPQRIGRVDG